MDSTYADTYYHRGICYVYLLKPDKAIKDYNKAIKLQPAFLAAYQERASLYYSIGEYKLALRNINSALQLDSASTKTPCFSKNAFLDFTLNKPIVVFSDIWVILFSENQKKTKRFYFDLLFVIFKHNYQM